MKDSGKGVTKPAAGGVLFLQLEPAQALRPLKLLVPWLVHWRAP